MAYHVAHQIPGSEVLQSFWASVTKIFSGIGSSLMLAASANRRMVIVERLQEKSDAELAAIGIRREDIVRHVFSDILYV
ncbi:DUF1127 domain-containing protein [Roseobacter sp. EG26]